MYLITAGGHIFCAQCAATSKRTKRQCCAPAMRGKRTCRFHGGKSRGPTTDAGRAASATAKTIHGMETRAIRAERAKKLRELKAMAKLLGVE